MVQNLEKPDPICARRPHINTTEIEQLFSKYKHGNIIHELGKH